MEKKAKGGARIGAGRKKKELEIEARKLALNAIVKLYGSVERGFEYLLRSGEPMLVKFAWGHAVGNPKDTVDIDMKSTVETIQVVKLPSNNRDKA